MAMTTQQKFERPAAPKLSRLEKGFAGIPEGSLLYISTPRELDEQVRAVPAGAVTTVTDLRAQLADSNAADATCPVTTAIFLRVVAERALEQLHDGAPIEEVAPFWRVIDPGSPLARRIPGAPEFIAEQRRAEGA